MIKNKFLLIILLLSVIVVLGGCGKGDTPSQTTESQVEPAVAEVANEPTETEEVVAESSPEDVTESEEIVEEPVDVNPLVIGYSGDINPIQQRDFDQACSELQVECVKGDSMTELADMGVDAIIFASNRWSVNGSAPEVHELAGRGFPIFVLNAEMDEDGVYNLSAENEIYAATFTWMFQQMDGKGKFVYYNFGDSDYIQYLLDMALVEYPDINAVKMPADYNGNSFEQPDIENMINADPEIAAIWSTEQLNTLFWGINSEADHHPVTECMVRKDELTSWQNVIDSGSDFQCIAHIRPGGTAYEGIYAAYYFLNGMQFKSDAFFEGSRNSLGYDIPVITNDTLSDWIGPKMDTLREGDYGFLSLPPMTPEEIKAKWFEE